MPPSVPVFLSILRAVLISVKYLVLLADHFLYLWRNTDTDISAEGSNFLDARRAQIRILQACRQKDRIHIPIGEKLVGLRNLQFILEICDCPQPPDAHVSSEARSRNPRGY